MDENDANQAETVVIRPERRSQGRRELTSSEVMAILRQRAKAAAGKANDQEDRKRP